MGGTGCRFSGRAHIASRRRVWQARARRDLPAAPARPRVAPIPPARRPPLPAIVTDHLAFPGSHPLFEDHFPGAPRVPGSIIASALLRGVRRAFPGHVPVEVARLRFRHFLLPGAYVCSFELDDAGTRARCRVLDGERCLVEGTITVRAADAAGGNA